MAAGAFALGLVACALLYYLVRRRLRYFDAWGVPYIPCNFPFGSLGSPFRRSQHFCETMVDIYNLAPEAKYVGAFNFTSPVIVLRDPELIKSLAIKHFDSFPNHRAFADDSTDRLFGGNLFNLADERWREMRALVSPAFTSSKIKTMFKLVARCADNFSSKLAEREKSMNEEVNSKDLFSRFTNDAVATCAFGLEVDSLSEPSNDFYVLGRRATNLDAKAFKLLLGSSFPWLVRLLNIQFVEHEIRLFFEKIVEDTMKMREESGESRPDVLQMFMEARARDSKHFTLDITAITAQLFIFFFGGFDTTSTQMCIIAQELAINQDVQRKLQDEIDEVLRVTEGKPMYEHVVNGLPYLEAVFRESMRKHTQSPFLDRICSKTYELPAALPGAKPFTIKPGMEIWIPAGGIHMDPKYYDEPRKFQPERYLDKKVTINDVENLGFGIGPRSCIGNRFAQLEIKVLFFYLLARFNLKPTKKTSENFDEYDKSKFTIAPPGGWWLALESRKAKDS